MKFGVHVSISGGFDQAVIRASKLGCETFQFFSTNPRGWKGRIITEEEADEFSKKLGECNIEEIVIHTPYLINLASPKEGLYKRSINALKAGVKRADKLGVKYLVLHPGSHTGSGIEAGLKRITEGLEEVLLMDHQVTILLENVAGAGTSIGSSIDELAQIADPLSSDKLGICYDTCHGFAAGYDLREEDEVDRLLDKIDSNFGIEKLGVIHLNDSKGELGSNKDRHHHIGQGEIGLKGFDNIVNHSLLKDKLFILETPIDEDGDDEENLATIRSLIK